VAAIVGAVVVALVLVIGVAYALSGKPGGGGSNPTLAASGPPACGYKLAYLGVLSGTNASDGKTIRDSAQLAVERYNSAHGKCTVELVQYDTTGNDDEAVRLANTLVKDDKVLGVVGPIWFTEAQKVLPILDSSGAAAISPSLTQTGLSQHGWKVFHRTIGTDADQAIAAARYLTSTMQAHKVYVIGDNDENGTAVADEVRRRLGSGAVGSATIRGDEKDFASVVSNITATGADALYFAGYYDAAGVLVKQLRAASPDIKVVSWDRIFTDLFITGAGKSAAQGVVITCPCVPPSEADKNFGNDFKAKYGQAGYYGPEAFDATNVLLAAIGVGKATRADVLAYINQYDGQGVSRRIKFRSSGDLDVSVPTVWAYKVENGSVYKDQQVALG
jgi:branched-chain amino acid transport system substrate-binding protein